jgi:hypothetical protein
LITKKNTKNTKLRRISRDDSVESLEMRAGSGGRQ